MTRFILLVALFAVHGIQCRSISLPTISSDEQSEHLGEHIGNELKREKKSIPENPSEREQQIGVPNPLLSSLIERQRPTAPFYSGAGLPVRGSVYSDQNRQLVHPHAAQHQHQHHHEHRPYAFPSLYPVHPKPLPVFAPNGDVMKKLRSMFDDSDAAEDSDEPGTKPSSLFGPESSPAAYYPPVPSQSYYSPETPPQPQYQPYAVPQYESKYEQPPKYFAPSQYEPRYEPKPTYEAKPNYDNSAAAAPKYVPQYQTPQYSPTSCGSNLLIGCRPHVQTVPCYPTSSNSAPSPYNPSYKPPNPTIYPSPPPAKPSADVYLQPGPPYPEPTLSSESNGRNQVHTEKTENESQARKSQDSEPESSNIERNTNERDTNAENLVGEAVDVSETEAVTSEPTTTTSTTETPTTTTTTVAPPTTTAPPPTTRPILQPFAEEQIRKIHGTFDSHVENIKRFKEDAGKKLREAIERTNARSAIDDDDDDEVMQSLFDGSAPFAKRHLMNRDFADNAVW